MDKQITSTDCDFAMGVVMNAINRGLTLEQLNKLIVAAWGVLNVSTDKASGATE